MLSRLGNEIRWNWRRDKRKTRKIIKWELKRDRMISRELEKKWKKKIKNTKSGLAALRDHNIVEEIACEKQNKKNQQSILFSPQYPYDKVNEMWNVSKAIIRFLCCDHSPWYQATLLTAGFTFSARGDANSHIIAIADMKNINAELVDQSRIRKREGSLSRHIRTFARWIKLFVIIFWPYSNILSRSYTFHLSQRVTCSCIVTRACWGNC